MCQQTFIAKRLLIVMMLLPCLLVSVSRACSSSGGGGQSDGGPVKPKASPSYISEEDTVTVQPRKDSSFRFRRTISIDEEGSTASLTTTNIEVFQRLDRDQDDQLSVVDWSLEGGSVKDFWALMTRHDDDGDEGISQVEFQEVLVELRVNSA